MSCDHGRSVYSPHRSLLKLFQNCIPEQNGIATWMPPPSAGPTRSRSRRRNSSRRSMHIHIHVHMMNNARDGTVHFDDDRLESVNAQIHHEMESITAHIDHELQELRELQTQMESIHRVVNAINRSIGSIAHAAVGPSRDSPAGPPPATPSVGAAQQRPPGPPHGPAGPPAVKAPPGMR